MNANQEHLLKLVLEIDDICRRNEITYFIDYGSMLGAVRHEGFIPWDQDIDISMTEENYDKFKEACIRELDQTRRTFCDNRMNREFPTVYGHYIDLETCRMSGHTTYWDNLCGQSIDIFSLIELPPDPEEQEDFINRFYAYDEFCNESFRHFKRKVEPVMTYYRQYQKLADKIGKERVLKQLEKEFFGGHYEGCDTLMAASARGGEPLPFVPKSAYEYEHRTPFEGHMLPIPNGYGDLLTLFYGDSYNLFPLEPKRYSVMSDYKIPCKVYVEDFLEVTDKETMLKDLLDYKKADVEAGYQETRIQKQFYKALGLRIGKVLARDIQLNGLDLNAIIESGTHEELEELDQLFNTYITKQLDPGLRYWRVHFDVDEDIEYAAMYLLFHVRDNRKAIDRMFWLREKNGLPLTKKMKRLRDDMTHIRNLKKYLLYKDYEKAGKELEWALEHYPDSREVAVYRLSYLTETAVTKEDLECVRALAHESADRFGESMYFKKAIGDVYFKTGETDKAFEIYNELKETSNDGMLLLDIRKKEEEFAAR